MRVLIVPSWYPTRERPVNGIFIREQADALSRVHEVRVLYLDVLPRGSKRKPRRLKSTKRGYKEEIIEVPNLPLLWQFAYLWRLVRAYSSIRKDFQPDVVNSHIAVPAGWGSALLRRLFRVPVVLTENMSEFDPWLRRRGLRWMTRTAYSSADVVIAVSEGLRQRIHKHFKTKRVVIVPNIVNTSRFVPVPFPSADNGYKLLFVGLMDTPQKGVPFLLEALALLKKNKNLRIHITLVGDGALRSEYKSLARDLDLVKVTTFHGLGTHAEIAELMKESHALVLPSLHEALPLVIIESLASGRPVISTSCGGPEYMINQFEWPDSRAR